MEGPKCNYYANYLSTKWVLWIDSIDIIIRIDKLPRNLLILNLDCIVITQISEYLPTLDNFLM